MGHSSITTFTLEQKKQQQKFVIFIQTFAAIIMGKMKKGRSVSMYRSLMFSYHPYENTAR